MAAAVMGLDDPAFPDAGPAHRVRVSAFWIDATEVTNAQFEAFVRATGYRTVAERPPRAEDFPGVPADQLVAGSTVFMPPRQAVPLDNPARWWRYVAGADWRHPEGRASSIAGRAQGTGRTTTGRWPRAVVRVHEPVPRALRAARLVTHWQAYVRRNHVTLPDWVSGY